MFGEAIKFAARGSISKANAWAPIVGAFVIWLIAYLLGYYVVVPDTLGKGIIVVTACVAAAWTIIFLGKLFYWPYQRLAEVLPKSRTDLVLELQSRPAYEGALLDAEGHPLQPMMAFIVRITNRGEKLLERCQVLFGIKENFSYHVTAPFDLRQGEHVDRAFLRVQQIPDPRAIVYIVRPDDWKIPRDGPAWLPRAGTYEIKVLSADTGPAKLDIELIHSVDGWTVAPVHTT
jgi:hypothetical protein